MRVIIFHCIQGVNNDSKFEEDIDNHRMELIGIENIT